MPVKVTFEEPAAFVTRASGEVTREECCAAIAEIAAHPRFERGAYMVTDGFDVTGAPRTAELRALVADVRPLWERGMVAMAITTRPGFVYGVARMFSTFAEMSGLRVQVFSDLEKAKEWAASIRAEMLADRAG